MPWQRWLMMGLGVVAATAASTFTASAAGSRTGVVIALVVAFAILSVLLPKSLTATVTEAIVVLQWTLTAKEAPTAWAIPVALCLFVFHVVIALTALTPTTAAPARSIALRWSRRSVWVVVATIGMWSLLAAMTERRAPGNNLLTALGFLTLTCLVSMARPRRTSSD